MLFACLLQDATTKERIAKRVGRDKAWLVTAAGFSEDDAEELIEALRTDGLLPALAAATVVAIGGAAAIGVVTGTATTADVAPPPVAVPVPTFEVCVY